MDRSRDPRSEFVMMNQATCIALSAVFPLILVTMAIEHRRAIRFITKREWLFKGIVEYSMMGALLGLVVTVIGVQTNGLALMWAILVWALFGVSVLGIGFMLVAIVEQDRDDRADELHREREAEEQRAQSAANRARRRRWPPWRRASSH